MENQKSKSRNDGTLLKAKDDEESIDQFQKSVQVPVNQGNKEEEDDKQNNTIMQQINNFSLTPMNDLLAEATIEDHKYLLENVENKCAIAFFACVNRNSSLFNALRNYVKQMNEEEEDDEIKVKTTQAAGDKTLA